MSLGRRFNLALGACVAAATAAATLGALFWSGPPLQSVTPAPRLVLLYAPCTVNKRYLSPYNANVPYTPHLAAFGAGSVIFERHETEAGQSGLAYAALFSGVQADRHGVYMHPTRLDDHLRLAAETFSDGGYETYFWSVHPMASAELNYAQGVPPAHRFGNVDWPFEITFLHADDAKFLALLDGLRADPSRRAFVMTNFSVTHGPYSTERHEEFCRSYPRECPILEPAETKNLLTMLRRNYHAFSFDFEGTKRRLRLDEPRAGRLVALVESLYKSNVWYLDSLFGKVIDEIVERDLIDESLIAFTADHGEVLFTDNAMHQWTHGFALAPEDIEVPLLLRSPALGPRRYAGVTRSIDVFPTMAGLSNVQIRPGDVDGTDLSTALLRREEVDLLSFSHTALLPDLVMETLSPHFASLNQPFPRQDPRLMWVQVRRGDLVHKLTSANGARFVAEVYDRRSDPDDRHNLHDPEDAAQRATLVELEAYRQRLVDAYERSKAAREDKMPTERQEEILRSLGYIQ